MLTAGPTARQTSESEGYKRPGVTTLLGRDRELKALGELLMRGQELQTTALIDAVDADARSRGDGQWLAVAAWARSVLNNGLSRYEAALAAAEEVVACPAEITVGNWALPELTEAASRSGQPERARSALEQLRDCPIPRKLFISPRTVQYHLRKVLAKLDVSSRNELARVLQLQRRA